MRPAAGICASCRWWHNEGAPLVRDLAECRAGPPCGMEREPDPAAPYIMVPRPVWPITRSYDWCGRYAARAQPENPAPASATAPGRAMQRAMERALEVAALVTDPTLEAERRAMDGALEMAGLMRSGPEGRRP